MHLYALNDDRAGALRTYHTCATILRRELDVDPCPATRKAYEQILGGEGRPIPTVTTTAAVAPLVGRETEWAQLMHNWHAMMEDNQPRVVLLRGEAGIGKTRLVEEFLQWAARQGITTSVSRCYAAEGDLAFSPVISWLRVHPLPPLEDAVLVEVSRLLPELLSGRPALQKPPPLTEGWQRRRLFEALSRMVIGIGKPLLLVIDDLQWCDRDTLEWLHFLLRFDRDARVLILGAYRPEEIADNHPLIPLLQALRLESLVTEMDLEPLSESGTSLLASMVAGQEINADSAQFLYHETEGNPLFVVETVRAGWLDRVDRFEDTPGAVPRPLGSGLPPKVLAVLEARLAQVSPPARDLAALAAAIGREFTFKLLSQAIRCDEDILVRQLDELWQHRLVREHGVDAYDFSHDKLREVAYTRLSSARRRMLHQQIAKALSNLYSSDQSSVSRQLATHYEQGGLIEQAIPCYLQAAEAAQQVYSNEEAISLLQHGISLYAGLSQMEKDERNHQRTATQLYEMMGDVLEVTARHVEAVDAYLHALNRVPLEENIWQACLYRKIATAQKEHRLYHEALESCKKAESALRNPPAAADARWWDEWLDVQVEHAWANYWLAQWSEMDSVLKRVQPVVAEHGSSANRVRLIWVSNLMALRRDRYVVSNEMLTTSREGLKASRDWGDPKFIIFCQFELGFLHLWRREIPEAEKNLLTTLELVEKSGVLPVRTLCLTYLTVLNRFKGDEAQVEDFVHRALDAAEAAQMPDYIAAAKGSLSWLALRRGTLSEVEHHAREALDIWHRSPLIYPFQWQALWPLIGALLAENRLDEAITCVPALLEEKQQSLPERMKLKLEETLHAEAVHQLVDARLHLTRAAQLASEMGYL